PLEHIPELANIQLLAKQRPDVDEDVALAGQIGFEPARKIFGSDVFIDGIRVPYVNTKNKLEKNVVDASLGLAVPPYESTNSHLRIWGPFARRMRRFLAGTFLSRRPARHFISLRQISRIPRARLVSSRKVSIRRESRAPRPDHC